MVEYDPANDHQPKRESFINIEDERNLVDIHLKAKLQGPELPPELEQEEQKQVQQQQHQAAKPGLFKSIIGGIKEIFTENRDNNLRKKTRRNQISLADGQEYAEVYTEVTKTESKKAHAHVTWRLKNSDDQLSWSDELQLMPVMSSPTLRIHFESNIDSLRPGQVEDLQLRVRIPEEYTANHLILMLRLKCKKRFVGPLMLLFVKIIKRQAE